MFGSKTALAISLTFALTACETKEDVAKRLVQFNGKTLAQVSDIIGEPTLQNKTRAVWFYEATHTEYQPYYYGHRHRHHGYAIPYTYRVNCIYTASLKSGRVVASQYKGNSCQRFAPKSKKKRA
ncbi:MAG: hypothetical protein JKX71_06565 [Amylibacter sp.]|nr:hypothetical protein [Amylibacter sp.]